MITIKQVRRSTVVALAVGVAAVTVGGIATAAAPAASKTIVERHAT